MLFAKCLNISNCRFHIGMTTNNTTTSKMQTFNTINKLDLVVCLVEPFMIHLFLCEYFTILKTPTIFVGKIQLDVNCQWIKLAKHNIFSCTLYFFCFSGCSSFSITDQSNPTFLQSEVYLEYCHHLSIHTT
jgi:hypothetical protein